MIFIRILPILLIAALVSAQAASTGPAPAGVSGLSAQSLQSGLSGLTHTVTPETMISDQFRYEYGDRQFCQHHRDDERCQRPVNAVPEPSSYVMMAIGVLGLIFWRKFRSNRT